jgi:hypothetical protein
MWFYPFPEAPTKSWNGYDQLQWLCVMACPLRPNAVGHSIVLMWSVAFWQQAGENRSE